MRDIFALLHLLTSCLSIKSETKYKLRLTAMLFLYYKAVNESCILFEEYHHAKY